MFPAEQQSRFKIPAALRTWTVQRALEHRVENHLPAREFPVENGPQFNTTGVLFVARVLKRELRNETQTHRQVPGFRCVKMRQDAPAGEVRRITRLQGVEEHEAQGEIFREAKGRLQSEMRLVTGGQQGSLARSGPLRAGIQMRLQAVFAAGERLVFVDVDFKWILSP